ncbi:hypothetical protein FRC02_008247 [Tulasnella sp. 418]|nr:hypothetical protein FRC02_008247 [Tulasnella sp. 418]
MSDLPSHSTRVYLNERPERDVIPGTTFKTEKVLLSSLQPSKPTDVLVRVDYVSIDPAMRGWLDLRRSYIAPVEIGATMRAAGVGTVVAVHSQSSGALKPGDAVKGYFGEALTFMLYITMG